MNAFKTYLLGLLREKRISRPDQTLRPGGSWISLVFSYVRKNSGRFAIPLAVDLSSWR